MIRLNNKGFTLVEMLAVVVIMGILMAIMVPTVSGILKKNKEDNLEELKQSILAATKIYISDNRYNIKLDSNKCSDTNETRNIISINEVFLTNSHLPIQLLVDAGDLSDNVVQPNDRDKKLNLNTSYVVVQYNCSTKNYNYTLEDDSLKWNYIRER